MSSAIKGRQITAARGLAGWSAALLAERTSLTPVHIGRIEKDEVQPREGTLADIVQAFAGVGVEFTERGVRWSDDAIRIWEGPDAYLRMLDDVYYATSKKGGEVLFFCSSDLYSNPGEHEAEVRIREAGVRFRSIIAEGKQDPVWPRAEYRQIPKKYFHHNLQVIYGDKVAQIIEGGHRIIIIHNYSFAVTARNCFELIWAHSKSLPKGNRHDQ